MCITQLRGDWGERLKANRYPRKPFEGVQATGIKTYL